MCYKQYTKNFFVLFQAVKANTPVKLLSNHEYVYKSLEVFKKFPTEHDIKRVVSQHKIEDTSSLKAIKIEIPVSKW
jgi:hypothetical protein